MTEEEEEEENQRVTGEEGSENKRMEDKAQGLLT